MHDLVQQGKVLYWGTSEWSAQQITEAWAVARDLRMTPPTMEQPQYNLFEREKVEGDYAPLYDTFGLGTTIWSPLASGILTGKYNDGIPADSRMMLPGYEWLKEELASDKGKARLAKVAAVGEAGVKPRGSNPPSRAALVFGKPPRFDRDPRRIARKPVGGQPLRARQSR